MGRKFKISVNKKIITNLEQENDKNMSKGINILNKYKDKKNKERNARIGNIEEEIKSNTNLKIMFIALIVIVLFFLVYMFFEYAPILGINIFNNSLPIQKNIIEKVSNEENIYMNYNEELLIYSNNKLECYNNNGNKTWEYDIKETFNPNIYINKGYMVVANKSNGNIYIFSGKNELTNKKIDGKIDDVYLDENGNIAVEYSNSGYKKIISVFDKYGKIKYTAYVNSSSIMDIKLIDGGKKLILLQTDSSSLTIGTKICMIDSSKDDSIIELCKFENKLIFDFRFINDDIILVTNDSIIKYNINTNVKSEVHSLDSNQTNYISLSTNYFVAIETNKNKYNFISNKFDNTSISKIELDVLPKYIKNSGFLTYIVSENKILVVNKWGVTVKTIVVNLPPKDIIIFNNEKAVALIYSNRVEIVKL